MRTSSGLFRDVVAPQNVRAAYAEARKGKRRRPDVAAFAIQEEVLVDRLGRALAHQRWRPGRYRLIVIREPKVRLIAAAPFRDRIVHHAIHRVLAPELTRRFIHDNYACLPGRGTHRAVLRFQHGLRRHPWVVRLDMQRYFLEIDWDVLLGIVGRQVRDGQMMGLLETVLRSGSGIYSDPELLEVLGLAGVYQPHPRKGLPIGNLTSQLFANVHLDGLDHFAKRELKVPLYIRYMDDVVLFGPDRRAVARWARACIGWLAERRRLQVHPERTAPQDTRQTFRFLGHVVSRTRRRVQARTIHRMLTRVRDAARGGSEEDLARLEQSIASSLGSVVF